MLENIDVQRVLFLDIETASQNKSYDDLSEAMKLLWNEKSKSLDKEASPEELYSKAALFAEFGKVICISLGYISEIEGSRKKFRMMSFYGHDEAKLLADFSALLDGRFNFCNHFLCAHNGKGFDIPYLCRRMLINGIKIPSLLDVTGKKPWEINYIDTMELWKFGDWRSSVSLNLLANIFGIPTPKDDIDGSQVGEVYWVENDLERIERYCRKDVLTLAQVYLKFRREALIAEDDVVVVKGKD